MNRQSRLVALAFFAHPDDAEILCAGTLARLKNAGYAIHIATATAGDCGTTVYSSEEISRIRTQEATKSAAMLGGTYHCLGELDGRVAYTQATSQKAIDLFRRIAPSIVFTHPRHDYMIDHEQVHLLARAASFIYGAPNVSTFPPVPGSGVPHLYYVDPIEGIEPLGNEVTPTTLVDISGQIEIKSQMLACHASQREWLRAHHGMDEYIDSMRRHGSHRGKLLGTEFAEGFIQHKGHAYPQDDVLQSLFGTQKASK